MPTPDDIEWARHIHDLLKDRERLEFILKNHLKSHSPHMDGTFSWSFRGLMNGVHKTGRDALDFAIMKSKEPND